MTVPGEPAGAVERDHLWLGVVPDDHHVGAGADERGS
jgi:hypothetical protein